MSAAGRDLLAASRREQELYAALLDAYQALAERMAAAPEALDAPDVQGWHERAGALVADLAAIQAVLGPQRTSGEPVASAIRDCWHASAELAAKAAEACRLLLGTAQAGQRRLQARLDELASGRRGLAGYRPRPDVRGHVAQQRA